jgi:hypothetical protein
VMGSKLGYSVGWVCATPVWLAGLIFSIVIGRDFLKGRSIKTLVWMAVIGFLGILVLFVVGLATGVSF